jgi:thiol-disulfide isomerase/thioredoxin
VSVPVLPADGFAERLRGMGRAVVLFTVDWCPHCRRFDPVFEAAAARHTALPLVAADVSDDDADPRWEQYRIEVVPTVLLFDGGLVADRLDGALGRGLSAGQLEEFLRRAGA